MSLIIVNPAPVLRAFHLRNGRASEASQVPVAWNLDASIQIKEAVHDGVAVGNLNNVTIREDGTEGAFKNGSVVFAVEVIDQQESSTQQMFP